MSLKIDSLTLWNAQESDSTTDGDLRVDTIPTLDSDETLLTSLEADESFKISGIATGNRILNSGDYPNASTPAEALKYWLLDLETFPNGGQGTGYTLTDPERDRTINTLTDTVSWTIQQGAPLHAKWSMFLYHGEGAMPDHTRSPKTPATYTKETLTDSVEGTIDLGDIIEKRVEKSEKMEIFPVALLGADNVEVFPKEGVKRTFTLTGRVTGTDTELRAFDNSMRSIIGLDRMQTYKQVIPGESVDVMVDQYSSTHETGVTQHLNYTLKLAEGREK